MPIPESRELRDEQFWRDGADFRRCWPKFNVTTPADKRVRSGLNRYPHNVIGAYVVVFGRSWGVRWKESFSSSRLRARAIRKGGIGSDEAYQIWKRRGASRTPTGDDET